MKLVEFGAHIKFAVASPVKLLKKVVTLALAGLPLISSVIFCPSLTLVVVKTNFIG